MLGEGKGRGGSQARYPVHPYQILKSGVGRGQDGTTCKVRDIISKGSIVNHNVTCVRGWGRKKKTGGKIKKGQNLRYCWDLNWGSE